MEKEDRMTLFQQPGEEDFSGLVAENLFVSDIQAAIEAALADRKLSQSDLARLLGVSPARVSQMLGGNGANLTARTVARVAAVLGLRACVTFTDTCLEGWWREEQEDDEPTEFADWVRVACQTLEDEGIQPGAPVNDGWTGGPAAQNQVAGGGERLVAA
jgi:transcriptional regulator with XRE-family HTH domain